MKKFTRLAAVIAVVAAFAVAPAAAASAAPSTAGSYCTQQVLVKGSTQPTPAPVCFSTQAARDKYFAQLSASSSSSPATTTNAPMTATTTTTASTGSSIVLLGTLYQGFSWTGPNISMWGVGGCVNQTFSYPTMQQGWADTVNSAQGAGNCWVSIYDQVNFGGNVITCANSCDTLSTMDDRNQSVIYAPTGTWG